MGKFRTGLQSLRVRPPLVADSGRRNLSCSVGDRFGAGGAPAPGKRPARWAAAAPAPTVAAATARLCTAAVARPPPSAAVPSL